MATYEIQVKEEGKVIKMTCDDGCIWSVPNNPQNRHYQALYEEHGQQFLDDIENAE